MKTHTLLDIISQIYDEDTIINYENILSYKFALPILLTGALMNFLMLGFVFYYDFLTTCINSLFLLLIAVLFMLTL